MQSRLPRIALWVSAGAMLLTLTTGLLTAHSQGPDILTEGKNAYLENCAACHNASHRVGPPLAKDLGYFVTAGVPVPVAAGMLTHAVRQRPPESRMPAFAVKDLSDQDVSNITAYLCSLTPTPAKAVALGTAENGAWPYSVACASCHGDAGEGRGHAPALAGMANMFKGMNAPPNTMQAIVNLACRSGSLQHMPTFSEKKLSDGQLADIAAFIWTLPPPPAPPTTPPANVGSRDGGGKEH